MKKSELIQVFMALKVSYGALFKYPTDPKDDELDSMFEETWFATLKQFEYKDVISAIQVIKLEGSQYPPNDGIIAKKVIEHRKPDRESPEEAWNTAQSISFNFNKKYFPQMLENISEEVKKTVRLEGGWEQVYYNDSSYDRTRFMKTYSNIIESEDSRTIQQVAGVADKNQIEGAKVSTEQIEQGLKQIGRK